MEPEALVSTLQFSHSILLQKVSYDDFFTHVLQLHQCTDLRIDDYSNFRNCSFLCFLAICI